MTVVGRLVGGAVDQGKLASDVTASSGEGEHGRLHYLTQCLVIGDWLVGWLAG